MYLSRDNTGMLSIKICLWSQEPKYSSDYGIFEGKGFVKVLNRREEEKYNATLKRGEVIEIQGGGHYGHKHESKYQPCKGGA